MVNRLLTGALEAHFITEDHQSHEWICFQLLPATSSTPPPPTVCLRGLKLPLCLFLSQKSQHQLKGFQKNVNFHFISQSKKQVFRPFAKAATKERKSSSDADTNTKARATSPHSLDIWKVLEGLSVSRDSPSHGLHPPLLSGPGHHSFTRDVI